MDAEPADAAESAESASASATTTRFPPPRVTASRRRVHRAVASPANPFRARVVVLARTDTDTVVVVVVPRREHALALAPLLLAVRDDAHRPHAAVIAIVAIAIVVVVVVVARLSVPSQRVGSVRLGDSACVWVNSVIYTHTESSRFARAKTSKEQRDRIETRFVSLRYVTFKGGMCSITDRLAQKSLLKSVSS